MTNAHFGPHTLSSHSAITQGLSISPGTQGTLDLSKKLLSALPLEVFQNDQLTELNAGHNRLTTIPTEIGKLRALTVLDVRFVSD